MSAKRIDQEARGPELPELPEDLRGCTIHGVPVEEIVSPTMWHVFSRAFTDQGIAEKDALKVLATPGVSVTEPNHLLNEFRDKGLAGQENFQDLDPMTRVRKKYDQPGMVPGFVDRVESIDQDGDPLIEGAVVVKNANGDPVKYRSMVLVHTPQEIHDQKMKYYAKKGVAQISQIENEFHEKQARAQRGENPGSLLTDAIQE